MTAVFGVQKKIEFWDVEEFIALPHHEDQRDTEARALKYNKPGGHLSELAPNHDEVRIAVRPDGSKFRSDGNTRAYLWAEGLLERPKQLIAVVSYCNTEQEFEDAYYQVDSLVAAKTKRDGTYSAMAHNGLRAKSKLIKGQIATALGCLFVADTRPGSLMHPRSDMDVATVISEHIAALAFVDELNLGTKRIDNGILGGALILAEEFQSDPVRLSKLAEFLKLISKNKFTAMAGKVDAVFAILHQKHMLDPDGQLKKMPGDKNPNLIEGGWERAEMKARRFVQCFGAFEAGKMLKNNEHNMPKVDGDPIRGRLWKLKNMPSGKAA